MEEAEISTEREDICSMFSISLMTHKEGKGLSHNFQGKKAAIHSILLLFQLGACSLSVRQETRDVIPLCSN